MQIPDPVDSSDAQKSGATANQFGRRRMAGNALAITITNGITALASLALQIVAARELGLAGYGAFALCNSILATALQLYTGYVGDALTVMDRHHLIIRRALVTSALVGLIVAFAIGFGSVMVLHIGGSRVALIYGAMLVVWLVEETGRRLLIVRLEYWRLVVNDATYLVATLAVLAAAVIAGSRVTLLLLLGSMLVGCFAAVGLALIQLPSTEYRGLTLGLEGNREVAKFAVWRSLQATLRQLQLLGSRVLIGKLLDLTAVGVVESGRLVIAPLQTVLNGAGDFLLSTGAARQRSKRGLGLASEQASIVLGILAVVISGAATALSYPLGSLLTRHPQPHWLVMGWGVYTCMWAMSLPFTAELAVRKLSLPVFRARLAETIIGLALVTIALLTHHSVELVPYLLAAPGLVNVWYLRRLAITSRPVPTAEGVAVGGA